MHYDRKKKPKFKSHPFFFVGSIQIEVSKFLLTRFKNELST